MGSGTGWISDFRWKSVHKNSKKSQKMSYRRKISRWIRIWHQNQRSTPHSWVIRERPVRNQLWLGPDSGDLVPIWSQIRTHHEILTLHIETLVLNSHSGGEIMHGAFYAWNLGALCTPSLSAMSKLKRKQTKLRSVHCSSLLSLRKKSVATASF